MRLSCKQEIGGSNPPRAFLFKSSSLERVLYEMETSQLFLFFFPDASLLVLVTVSACAHFTFIRPCSIVVNARVL